MCADTSRSLLLTFKREGCATMSHKWFYVSLLVLVIENVSAGIGFIDLSKYNRIYYDPNTQIGLKAELEDTNRNPLSSIGFRGVKCNCKDLACGCCTGVNVDAFNLDRRVCTNFTYVPEDFAIRLNLIMNENVVFNRTFSAKNPAPICVPFYLPFVSFCVRFFDLYTSGKNLHACIDFETRVINWPILVLHFDCVKLGVDGISWIKPENGTEVLQVAKPDSEIYDEVNFEPDPLNSTPSNTISQDDDHIGQLKL